MAKNLNDFIEDLKQDEALREALSEASSKDMSLANIVAFAAQKGYDFTEQEVVDLQKQNNEEPSEEELRSVAGGKNLDGGDAVLCIFFAGIEVIMKNLFG